MRREQYCNLLPFLFSQRVPGARLNCFLFFADISEDNIHSWENSFSDLYYRRLFELHFLLCCRSKRILQWFFFFPNEKKKKKVLGGKPRKEFSFWIGPNSSLLHFNWKSTQKTRKKKKMQLFFTDSQVSFRNFCGMIHVIRMIIAIGRQSGFFSDTNVCLNGECLALHLPTTSDWYEGIESWKISLSFSMTVTPLASEYHVTIS